MWAKRHAVWGPVQVLFWGASVGAVGGAGDGVGFCKIRLSFLVCVCVCYVE